MRSRSGISARNCARCALALTACATAAGQTPLSPFTSEVFTPDGDLREFVSALGSGQSYFVTSGTAFGRFRNDAELAPGVFPSRDALPIDGTLPAGASGFGDAPQAAAALSPTGFNLGRIFAAYNPAAAGGAYFIALDVSAPAELDLQFGTQPLAFDVDGDGSIVLAAEASGCAGLSEAPFGSAPDVYAVLLDLDRNGDADVRVQFIETADAAQAVPPNAVFLGQYQVPAGGGAASIRRWVQIDPLGVAMTPAQLTRFADQHLDSNGDGLRDIGALGIGADIELMLTRVQPEALDPVLDAVDPFRTRGGSRACVNVLGSADASGDECLSGGEDSIQAQFTFPQPEIELVHQARVAEFPAGVYVSALQSYPAHGLEFRVAVTNYGNALLQSVELTPLNPDCFAGMIVRMEGPTYLSRPPGIRDFAADFWAALPIGTPIQLDDPQAPTPGLLPAGGCTAGLTGETLEFTFVAEPPPACPAAACFSEFAVSGEALIDPIPGDEEDGTADEFTIEVRDALDTQTPREGAGDDRVALTVLAMPGDANCDGRVNNFDIDSYVAALLFTNEPLAPASYSGAQWCWDARHCWGDIDGDGRLNNFDIDPFVMCIVLLPPAGHPCPLP